MRYSVKIYSLEIYAGIKKVSSETYTIETWETIICSRSLRVSII